MKVGADLFLCTVTATGTVNLAGAQITGQLDCSGATFNGQTGPQSWGTALNAQGAKVGASLFLRTVTATGTVNLNGAQTEQLDCMEASFDGKSGWALNAQRLVVKQIFFWRKIQQIRGRVYLASAQVGDLADDLASWPADLYLDGFTYDRISAAPTDAKQRLGWLSNGSTINGTFSPQPYTQLAKVLFAMGHDRDARKVLMEREKRLAVEARRTRRRKSDGVVLLPFESPWEDAAYVATWLWDALTRWIVGYGFAPIRSFYWMIALLALTTALAQATWSEGSFAPNSDVILTSPSWTDIAALDCKGPLPAKLPDGFTTCDKNPAETWSDNPDRGLDWTSFNSGAYAADLVIPVLDLGQTSAWAPSKDRSRMGWIFWWASWWLEGLGWFITALGAAAITGLIQRDRE